MRTRLNLAQKRQTKSVRNRRPLSGVLVAIGNLLPSAVARRLRSNSVATRLIRPLIGHVLPSAPTPVVIRSGAAAGLRMIVLPQSEKFYWSGLHEVAVQGALSSVLKSGGVFWDVGAHAGFFTLLGARLVTKSGRVHAFEPIPENYLRLKAALKLNGIPNVTLHEVAISEQAGQLELSTRGSSLMWSAIRVTAAEGVATVRTETLDAFSDRLGFPDVVKVDVEGAEVSVFQGARRTLLVRKPILVVEFLSDERLKDATDLLAGYRFDRIDDKNWLLEPVT